MLTATLEAFDSVGKSTTTSTPWSVKTEFRSRMIRNLLEQRLRQYLNERTNFDLGETVNVAFSLFEQFDMHFD